jgi:hypothetical protein
MIDIDAHLLEALRYIHLNPVRAGLVSTPAEYRWSSHLDYLGRRAQAWVTTDVALRMFHAEHERAIAAYRRFIDAAVNEPVKAEPKFSHPESLDAQDSGQLPRTVLDDSRRITSGKTLIELIEAACRDFSITQRALSSPSRHRRITRARAWVAHQAVTLGVASLSEVARAFDRGESTLRESVKYHFDLL